MQQLHLQIVTPRRLKLKKNYGNKIYFPYDFCKLIDLAILELIFILSIEASKPYDSTIYF